MPDTRLQIVVITACAMLMAACTTTSRDPYALQAVPPLDRYCLDAQRVVTRTTVPMDLVVHEDFESFVKSKALIAGPTIHQFSWYAADGSIQGISCKMKSADHLNLVFGAGADEAAGPDGYCHEMNRQVYALLEKQGANPNGVHVVFDPSESLDTKEQAGMIGPTWLLPFTLTRFAADGSLHVASKGFTIDFTDARYQKFPPSWRGTHYCHLIAPAYLQALLAGEAGAGAMVGRAARVKRNPLVN
jgi:hypothetical protein